MITDWNPLRLIKKGVNEYEFDREIKAIVRQIERINSAEDAARVLSRVFSSSFEPSSFRLEDCRAAGARLFEALTESYGNK